MTALSRSAALCGALLLAAPLLAEQAPVSIDGVLDDWDGVSVAYDDADGDGGFVDFGELRIADDDRFLFLRLETGGEVDFSENNEIRIYLDTDVDASTGLSIFGIGAELSWRPGERLGFFYTEAGGSQVFHDDIDFRSGPTVTGCEFEMAFARNAIPNGLGFLFQGQEVRILIRDLSSGDRLPESGDSIVYTFDQGNAPPVTPIDLDKEQPADLRIATFNVLNDGPWIAQLQGGFERLLSAADPDIICFQEIYDHSASQTAGLVSNWLPDDKWSGVNNTDCKVVSRLPILDVWDVGNEVAVLIDASSTLGSDVLVINAHLPCCANDSGRQSAADGIMEFIRESMEPGGVLDLAPQTPIVITGDLNLVGLARQLETLVDGDIANNGSFGPDFSPDWDGTSLLDVIPRQTEHRMGWTWRSDSSSFWPGRLDFIITTDSVVDVAKRFLLYTPEMSSFARQAAGLEIGDSLVSDHILYCADLRPVSGPCVGDVNGDGVVDTIDMLAMLGAWGPNPGHPADLDDSGVVDTLDFLTLLGAWGPC